MTSHFIVTLGLGAALVLAPGTAAPQADDEQQVLQQYQQAVDAYIAVHRDVERFVPPLDQMDNTDDIQAAVDRMATAMQLARADARRGELFTPEVSRLFRTRLRAAAMEHRDYLAMLFAEARGDMEPLQTALAVNGRFPWSVGSVMPSCILSVLPQLPDELQYRFVGNDLILIDTHADLVVDILPSVLGET